MLHANGSRVIDELYRIDGAMLQQIDELEDYFGPGDVRNLYEREWVKVQTDQGIYEAWTYIYVHVHHDNVIPSGDWNRRN